MLIDQFGRPLRAPTRTEMTSELSAPTLGSVRQIQSSHPAEGITPLRLAAILREAETGDATAYLDLAEQMEEKDLHYAAVLGVRKRAIRSLDLIVEPGDDSNAAAEAADLVREVMTGVVVKEDLIDMLDAIGKGFSVCEIVWEELSAKRWMPVQIEQRPPQFFEFDRTNGRHLYLRGAGSPEPLAPAQFIIHLARAKSGLPIRGGLARLAAWAWMFKNYTVKDWSIFLEAYGHPLRLGKYDKESASDDDKRTLLRAARQIGIDMAAIIPRTMELEVIATPTGGTNEAYEKKARWWDEQLSKGVLGQVATTDAIAGGHAVGKIHEEVRSDIRDSDAEQLAGTLMRDLAAPLTRLNLGETVPVPRIRFQAPERIDPDKLLKLMEVAGPAGLRIATGDIYKAFSLREPDEADPILRFAPAPPALTAPLARPAPVLAAREAGHEHGDDPIRELIDELAGDGRLAAAAEVELGRIVDAIRAARTVDEVYAILDRAGLDAPGPVFVDLLAQSMFAARLSGEMGG